MVVPFISLRFLLVKNVLDHTQYSSREDIQNRISFWGLVWVFFNPLDFPARVVGIQVRQLNRTRVLFGMEG